MKKYIIIDTDQQTAVKNADGKTMLFNTYLAAEEVAFCDLRSDYIIIEIFLP